MASNKTLNTFVVRAMFTQYHECGKQCHRHYPNNKKPNTFATTQFFSFCRAQLHSCTNCRLSMKSNENASQLIYLPCGLNRNFSYHVLPINSLSKIASFITDLLISIDQVKMRACSHYYLLLWAVFIFSIKNIYFMQRKLC